MGVLDKLQKQLNKEVLTDVSGLQVLLRDDNSVVFRKSPIEHTCLVEKRDKDGKVLRAWKHYYETQYPFNGYKGIPSGMLTISFERDILHDPHGILPDEEKPSTKEGMTDLKRFKDIAASRRRQIVSNMGESLLVDKLTAFLFCFLLLEGIGIILKVVL